VSGGESRECFPEVFDSYAPSVLRFARRRLDDGDAAWDVVTDTFTSAWRHWDRRPATGELLPWLYAIAGNAVRDQRRSAGRRSRLIARLSAAGMASHTPDPADGIVLGQSVAGAFARLPAADQEVLRLVAWEGMTDARAIGLVLGLSPTAVRTRVHRARRRLRSLLNEPDAAPAETRQPETRRPEARRPGGSQSDGRPPDDRWRNGRPPDDSPAGAAGRPGRPAAANRVPEVPNVP
jgi:RNA polymerase sigma-70 factor, ECF subfamily